MTDEANAPAPVASPSLGYPRRWLAAVVMVGAVLIDMIDITIVNWRCRRSAAPARRPTAGCGGPRRTWRPPCSNSAQGHRFRRVSAIDEHHNTFRFAWELVGPDGAVAVTGIDVGERAEVGTLRSITGFFCELPARDEA
jgi:hypothetical protein